MTETEKREKSRSPSPSGAKKECNSWAQSGSCKFGDNCRFFHSALAAAKREKAAAAKASAPKAKSAPPKPGGAASGGAAMACVRRPRGEVGRRGSGITLGWTDIMHVIIDPDNQTKPCPKPKKGRVHSQHMARCDPTHCHASALRDAKELAAELVMRCLSNGLLSGMTMTLRAYMSRANAACCTLTSQVTPPSSPGPKELRA